MWKICLKRKIKNLLNERKVEEQAEHSRQIGEHVSEEYLVNIHGDIASPLVMSP